MKWSPEIREKIAAGMRRAHAEGRASVPGKRPEIAAKISAAKRRHNAVSRPEVRAQISTTLKAKYRIGQLTPPTLTQEQRARLRFNKPFTVKARAKISASLKLAWASGRFAKRRKRDPVPAAERRLREVLVPLGFYYQYRIHGPQDWRSDLYVDFGHPTMKIIVEVDGTGHSNTVRLRKRDRWRDQYLANLGFTVMRITNAEALGDLSALMARLLPFLSK